MKKLTIFFIGLTLIALTYSCKTGNVQDKHPFKIISKTYYNWSGGQQGVKGTNVVIKMLNVDLNSFKADSIYFKNKGVKVEMHSKKDTLILMGYFSTPRKLTPIEIEPYTDKPSKQNTSIKIPYTLKENEGILIYNINGKRKVLKLYDLVKTDSKYYP